MKTMYKRLAALLAALMMVVSVCGCASSSSSPTEEAEKAVNGMFDALKELDLIKAQNYINVEDIKLSQIEIDETTDYEMFMETLFDRLDYTIVSSEEVDSDTVNVVVEITAVDMKAVLADYMVAAFQYSFSSAFADPQPTEEETNKKMEELFIASATKEDIGTVTNEVIVKVTKQYGKWRVVADDDLADALFGGLIAASESLSDAFGE